MRFAREVLDFVAAIAVGRKLLAIKKYASIRRADNHNCINAPEIPAAERAQHYHQQQNQHDHPEFAAPGLLCEFIGSLGGIVRRDRLTRRSL